MERNKLNWINIKDKPISKSGFYKIMNEKGNIHYVKYILHCPFISGRFNDYRNGDPYPVISPVKYIYLYGLNKHWEPDERVKKDDWPEGL